MSPLRRLRVGQGPATDLHRPLVPEIRATNRSITAWIKYRLQAAMRSANSMAAFTGSPPASAPK